MGRDVASALQPWRTLRQGATTAMLEQQHLQGAIFSRMMLGLIGELFSIYRREGSNPGMIFNDLLVSMTIYARADTDAPEVTVPEIIASTRLARSNVDRSIEALLAAGLILRIEALRNSRFVS